jgi:hypothetical protein
MSPTDLRSAYKLPSSGGSGQTIAIVDAYNDPNAYSDLKTYRKTYKLTECTEESGCFKKVNQKGETKNYPPNAEKTNWGIEISLDLDMASAICSECHILLVEAPDELGPLEEGEKEAATLEATEISNSWGLEENELVDAFAEPYFDHPGIPITASAGDSGYGVEFPSTSQHVISVGGTTLKKAINTREWEEAVWSGTGAGCSKYIAKPRWQTDAGCSHRTANDVAADANGEVSPASVYDSYEHSGWITAGGTSVAAPIVAGVEALSSSYTRSLGAEAFYIAGPDKDLFDITEGNDGSCEKAIEYLCHAESGYDGPTGWGTPDGALTLKEGSWSSLSPSKPTGSEASSLESVSCVSATACMAVGYYKTGATYPSFADELSGTEWKVQTPPLPTGAKSGELRSVSCTAASACTAIGKYISSTEEKLVFADRWNGTEWKVQTAASHTGTGVGNDPLSVSCTSATACEAVGYFTTSSASAPLAESWNGSEWKLQSPINPTGSTQTSFYGVSCTSSTACTAVGLYLSSGRQILLAERWNGTEWTVQEPPNPSTGTEPSSLSSVSCVTATDCTAVGSYRKEVKKEEFAYKTFAERWNGSTWTTETTPNPSGGEAVFKAVSCASYTNCIASGYSDKSGEILPYAARWSGSEWVMQTPPGPSGAKVVRPYGASCWSSQACITVGGYTASLGEELLFADSYN